ncbi:hypothetical protein [Propionimicrobium sp. PCR01-08-3]|uniref:hypothetical protein n=1 Tax=Propionimicrobium sp. PCR01-08-3 TaxID=3052086 RepID=UPI00255CABF8|nr:hypothetical protein [Propionimicrobium sp. PCR01-08-3]WIY84340.1 hypothetical protein QQ658_15120 [Propionimicrobium sp. PCR01-08-3]
MSWSVHLIETLTGQVVARIGPTAATWSDGPLNGIPECKATVPKYGLPRRRVDGGDLPDVLREYWERSIFPWSNGLLVCYDGQPLTAGPITAPPAEKLLTVDLSAQGIEALLNQWIVLDKNYPDGEALAKGGNVKLSAGNLSRLAWLYVQQSIQRNGYLPIVDGMPDADGTANYRDMEPWNLQNNGLWKRLTEMTEVINGPDIAFRPEWMPGEEGSRIRWRMVAGSTVSPYIGQERMPRIDMTAPHSTITSVGPKVAWTPSTRVYGYGSGEGAGQIIAIATAEDSIRYRLPVLESVMADGGVDNAELVQQHTDADVAAKAKPTVQVPISLACDDPSAGVSRWWTGDACMLVPDTRWWSIPKATKPWRCINRSGTVGASTYTVELQED